jgi:AcrR family transcriptional regulator
MSERSFIIFGGKRMAETRTERRERLHRERTAQILSAATAIFAARGYEKATIREIAQAAGVAEGTIYNYYPGKRDLLVALVNHLSAGSMRLALTMVEPLDEKHILVALLHNRLQALRRNEQLLRAVLPEVVRDDALRTMIVREVVLRITGEFEALVRARIAAGAIRPYDPRLVTRILMGSVLGLLGFTVFLQDPLVEEIPEDDLVEQVSELLLHGLLVPGQDAGKE